MQEVCSSLDPQMGPQIKSESPVNPLQSQTNNQSQLVNKIGTTNCDKRQQQQPDTSYWMTTESGFINSQPSMAEFLTHLSPDSPKMSSQGYQIGQQDGIDNVPEYPWMKEKKTARKNSAQGKVSVQMNETL